MTFYLIISTFMSSLRLTLCLSVFLIKAEARGGAVGAPFIVYRGMGGVGVSLATADFTVTACFTRVPASMFQILWHREADRRTA